MPRNPLREEESPQQLTDGEEVTNLRRTRTTRLVLPDGTVRFVPVSTLQSSLGDDGVFEDNIMENVIYDAAGNPLVNPNETIISHSGLYISSPEQMATCTSPLHLGGSRIISIGQDGTVLQDGRAVCSRCQGTLGTIYLVLAALGVAVVLGIFSGVGLF